MTQSTSKTGFTPQEIRGFKIYAIFIAAIAASMFVVAPKALGKLLGYFFRRSCYR
jgi:hypothetical protein